jgi:excinuclease ABC subunit A
MERAEVDEIKGLSPAIAINQKALSHNPRSTVGTLTEIYDYLRVLFARLGKVYCPVCGSKIEKLSVEEMVDIIESKSKEISTKEKKLETVIILAPVIQGRKGEYYQLLYDYLKLGYGEARIDGKIHSLHEKIELSRYKNHNIEIVIDKLLVSDESRLFEAVENAVGFSRGLVAVVFSAPKKSDSVELILSSKWTCWNDNFTFPEVEPRLFSFNSPFGACPSCSGLGKINPFSNELCPECKGKRLKPEALSVKINGKNIFEVSSMTIEKAYEFFGDYESKLTAREKLIAETVIREIKDRLKFLLEVGLDYLTLTREAGTLSGGEAQRIRLSSQIGSHLSNTLYVLDEPTIGLHERDTDRLIKTLKSIRDSHNTVIVVEHDERSIFESDYLVDLGPLAGKQGGEVMAAGPTKELLKGVSKHNSLTLDYLAGREKIEKPDYRRTKLTEKINIIGARANNLKNINLEIPLRKLVVITGVSGSGKSSLVHDVLYDNLAKIKARANMPLEKASKISGSEYIDSVEIINQSPIGRTPRSNPATYTGIFTPIREFFAELPEAREKGYSASRFSFNVFGGRCEACEGAGFNLIEMHFLPPVLVPCEVCNGKRFNRETLQIKYKNKNIAEVLEMTVDEAEDFFENIYQITDKTKVLREVGLGYLQLGQSATTLSGGEAQRIKLGRELTQPLGKKVLYLLDEPTVGLHYHDIKMLLKVLNKLVEKGSSVVVIEHNMHIIKSADYVIDLGPEGGERGGRVVAAGTPEEVARNEHSYTGKYLKKYL